MDLAPVADKRIKMNWSIWYGCTHCSLLTWH